MTDRPAETVLETRNLSLKYGEQEILRDVSFSIRQGEYVSIVGPNGAGKTTLLKVVDRLVSGSTGEVSICGKNREAWRPKELAKNVAFVPQADSRVAPFTVEQFLLMCRYPHLRPFASVGMEDRRLVQEAMEKTRTAAFAQRRLDTLSSGERQRVYIASALAQGSHLWLVDEPTTFLDYHYQDEILSLIAWANKELRVTIVIVTHDLNRAVLESQRILALREGRLVFFDTPERIMRPDVLEEIYGASLLTVAHPQAGLPMIVPRRMPGKSVERPSKREDLP